MTEIQFRGDTYRGTAEGDHGVFTHCFGAVYAGQIAGDAACVGVLTDTDGNTRFVECDADGEEHGRALRCTADTGNTWYGRYEHGSQKEYAWLYADGTCAYNGEACRADYAPFVALQAMVVPVKARPSLVPQQPPFFMPHFFAPTAPKSVHRPLFWHSQALATTHADKVCTCRLRHQPAWDLWHSNLPNKCTARPIWTTHRRKDAPRMRHDRMRSAPFRRLCTRSEPPCASALPIACRTPSGSVAAQRRAARVGFAPHAPHAHADARRRRVSHRAPALRPHLTHQIAMRIRRAHNLERFFSDLFGPQKSGWGSAPSPGFAVLPFALVGQARKAVADKKAAEAAEKVRSSPHGTCWPQVPRVCAHMARVRRNDARNVPQQWPPVAHSGDGLAGPDRSKAAWLSGCTHDGVRCAASLQLGALPFRRRRALCLRSMYFEGSALPTR
jgi:hypothetical protein